ncbi:hypothetical protein Tco_0836410 [Tanacetum coccineum]
MTIEFTNRTTVISPLGYTLGWNRDPNRHGAIAGQSAHPIQDRPCSVSRSLWDKASLCSVAILREETIRARSALRIVKITRYLVGRQLMRSGEKYKAIALGTRTRMLGRARSTDCVEGGDFMEGTGVGRELGREPQAGRSSQAICVARSDIGLSGHRRTDYTRRNGFLRCEALQHTEVVE